MARLQIKNVGKNFGKTSALRNIDLEVKDKELFVLVGPSGCGKSTLLRLVAGLEDATSGDILIDGERVNDLPPRDRNVSMVFQNYALYPHMTAYNNMAFGLKMRGYSQREVDARVTEAADVLGITDLLHRRPGEISGGQRQRVALGRAIVRKPRLFLFDEPLSNLDVNLRAQTRTEILHLHRRLRTTMVYVTHDQVEAMIMGDRLCVLNAGEVQQVAAPLDIYRGPKNRFVAGFIGNPSMNFLEVKVVERKGGFWLDQGRFQLKLPTRTRLGAPLREGQPLILGVRPEDIHDRLFHPELADEGNSLLAVVRLLEPVGPETFVHTEAGGAKIIARVDSTNPLRVNHPVELAFDMEKVSLFSPDGGERLTLEV